MAVKDGNNATPEVPTDAGETEEIYEVLDEEENLKMYDRGPREGRWPTNDYY